MKKLFSAVAIVILMFLFPFLCSAYSTETESYEDNIRSELFSAIDNDVLSVLEEMGINENNYLDPDNYSLNKISNFFAVTLKEKAQTSARNIFTLLCVIMLCGAVSSVFSGSRNENFISYMSVIILMLLAVNIVAETLSATIGILKLSGKFMLSYVPVYTLIISLAGNVTSAVTYNSFIMIFAEVISSVITHFLPDVIGMLLCLVISFSLNECINIDKLVNFINKSVSLFLGVSAGAFTGFLSVKNVLSVSFDSVSVKSIRFLISSLIPVIGSSISEAYSSLLGSINLIKGSVAIVGIFVVLIINLPVLLQTLIYYLSFTALSYLSDSFSGVRIGASIRGVSCVMRVLMLLCVFEMFILIISTGIMLSLKGAV